MTSTSVVAEGDRYGCIILQLPNSQVARALGEQIDQTVHTCGYQGYQGYHKNKYKYSWGLSGLLGLLGLLYDSHYHSFKQSC